MGSPGLSDVRLRYVDLWIMHHVSLAFGGVYILGALGPITQIFLSLAP